eukprot:scaffold30105_cov21-Tisochrysis_lutea.AAC.1
MCNKSKVDLHPAAQCNPQALVLKVHPPELLRNLQGNQIHPAPNWTWQHVPAALYPGLKHQLFILVVYAYAEAIAVGTNIM